MPETLTLLLSAGGLGFAYAAAPGAVNTEAIRRGFIHGAGSTLFVEIGSLLGDSLWALLALTGVALLAQHLAVQIVLGIAGGCFLLRMGWSALHDALVPPHAPTGQAVRTRGDFATGVFFGLANPFGLAFWSGLGSSVLVAGASGLHFALFFIGFFCGAVLWCLVLALALRWGRRWMRPSLFRWLNAVCGLVLGYIGVRLLWTTLQALLERQFALGIAEQTTHVSE
jgi:threonine/homoserine/homoserine lactone efflux protein